LQQQKPNPNGQKNTHTDFLVCYLLFDCHQYVVLQTSSTNHDRFPIWCDWYLDFLDVLLTLVTSEKRLIFLNSTHIERVDFHRLFFFLTSSKKMTPFGAIAINDKLITILASNLLCIHSSHTGSQARNW